MRASLARQDIVQYNSVEMRASLARQDKFSIVQYNSVFFIFKCGLHWLTG